MNARGLPKVRGQRLSENSFLSGMREVGVGRGRSELGGLVGEAE